MKKEIGKRNRRSFMLKTGGILLAIFMLLSPSSAFAADASYPTKPVRLIVPFDAGGTSDIVGRIFATELTKRLGKQVVVENRGGAGGTIGTAVAAKSPPDGYTLLLTSSAHPISFLVYKKLPYDYWNAFISVAKIGTGPNVLAVYAGLPVKSVKELIALAKEKPGKLLYSTAGVGGFQHLSSELFRMKAGIDLVAVHFKGGGPAVIDTIGGHSQISFASLIQNLPHIRSGKLKALGTGGAKRSVILPDVPTIAEAGVPGYEANNWWGIFVPAGTPPSIVGRLNKECSAILTSAETQKLFLNQGAEADYQGPEEFGKYIAAETSKFGPVIKQLGLTAQ